MLCRSVITATVRYSNKDSVVDVNRIQQILDKDYKPTTNHINKDYTSETIQVKEAGNLWWILIVLIILLLLLAAILILCCICEPCPLYVPPRKRKIRSSEVTRLVVKGSGQGKHSKSVQVAEWFGRKEAWSPEAVQIDGDAESLRRHEMERGSSRRPLHRQHNVNNATEPARDQFYIREGNAEILRLITRGGEQQQQQQRPITLMAEQPFVTDSGKEILMHRFIEQQQAQTTRGHQHQVLLPNSISRLQSENDLLEASLRQQNALLRQIILEREREMRLETQSLPAGTQTDQDAGTQTEPRYLLPSRRKVRSDNDASDLSDEETQNIRTKSKKRYARSTQRRKINTPILEESESTTENLQQRDASTDSKFMGIKQTRTSLLRQKKAADSGRSGKSTSSTSRSLKKEVLREISASLTRNASDESNTEDDLCKKRGKRRRKSSTHSVEFSDDSLEDYTPRSDYSLQQRYHSENDLRNTSSKSRLSKDSAKSLSQTDLRKTKKGKRVSKYMDWYKKGRGEVKKKEAEVKEPIVPKSLIGTETGVKKSVVEHKNKAGPEHPLLQHSEHRFEAQYPLRRPDEDTDSGIVLQKPPIAQKKSVFTIAYDDMHTSQLRPDSSTSP